MGDPLNAEELEHHCTYTPWNRIQPHPQPSSNHDFIASAFSLSLTSLIRVNASRMPFHASRSMRSSCNPRFSLAISSSAPEGSPTPREGGMNPGGGALIAEGAMRDCLICARDERMAIWMPCAELRQGARSTDRTMHATYIQAFEVLVRDIDELFRASRAFREVLVL